MTFHSTNYLYNIDRNTGLFITSFGLKNFKELTAILNEEFFKDKISKLFQVNIRYSRGFLYKMTPLLYWENLDNLDPDFNHFYSLVEDFYLEFSQIKRKKDIRKILNIEGVLVMSQPWHKPEPPHLITENILNRKSPLKFLIILVA